MTRILIAGALLPAMLACTPGKAETPRLDDAQVVRVAPVEDRRLARPVNATGTLRPKDVAALSFKVGGVLSRVPHEAGERVRSGTLLAALDPAEIDATVARAQGTADKAMRDLQRAERLYADSVATLEQVQDARTRRDVAAADLRAAEFNRSHAVILAPSDGVILRRDIEPGEQVGAGIPVLTFGSDARGSVLRAGLADRDVMRVQLGDSATVTFRALPGRTLQGRVTSVGQAADPATGTFRVEVGLTRASGLASGLVGHVEIRPAPMRSYRLIPIEAVLEADGERGTVFVPSSDGRAERRTIEIAFMMGDRVAVSAGLDGIGQVITRGAAYLDDGQAVSIRP